MLELWCNSEYTPQTDLQDQQTGAGGHSRQQKDDGNAQNQWVSLRRSTAGLSFPHSDGATHPLHVLQIVDGGSLSLLISQINEGKTPFPTGFTIQRHGALAHFAVLTEQMDEVFSLSVPGEISNEDGQKIVSKGVYFYFVISTSLSCRFTHSKG